MGGQILEAVALATQRHIVALRVKDDLVGGRVEVPVQRARRAGGDEGIAIVIGVGENRFPRGGGRGQVGARVGGVVVLQDLQFAIVNPVAVLLLQAGTDDVSQVGGVLAQIPVQRAAAVQRPIAGLMVRVNAGVLADAADVLALLPMGRGDVGPQLRRRGVGNQALIHVALKGAFGVHGQLLADLPTRRVLVALSPIGVALGNPAVFLRQQLDKAAVRARHAGDAGARHLHAGKALVSAQASGGHDVGQTHQRAVRYAVLAALVLADQDIILLHAVDDESGVGVVRQTGNQVGGFHFGELDENTGDVTGSVVLDDVAVLLRQKFQRGIIHWSRLRSSGQRVPGIPRR